MMDDEHARAIREAARQLIAAIDAANAAGLLVRVHNEEWSKEPGPFMARQQVGDGLGEGGRHIKVWRPL